MASPILQFKRGNAGVAGTVPALRPGEPAISLNNFDLFVGIDTSVSGNKFFGSHRYWGREDGTTSLRLKLVDKTGIGGTIQLKAPDSHTGVTTYTLPSTPVSGNFLKVAADGSLSWDSVTASGSFNNATLAGITSISGFLNNSANTSNSGITTFTNTTDNTLGNSNTGAVQIDGGLGVDKNITVGGNLNVQGQSEFVGVVTFKGGIINIGDGTGDSINIGGRFSSNLVPNQDNAYDVGISTLNWRNAHFSGIGTFENGATIRGVQIGIGGANVIDTVSGNLTLNSAGGSTIIDDAVTIQNSLTVTGAVQLDTNLNVNGNITLGGTSYYNASSTTLIRDKDIVLGVTTDTSLYADTSTDNTANHGGISIASTEGTPLVSMQAVGVNSLPDTYKQIMWMKSGTWAGLGTDAWIFNYGVGIGSTQVPNGVRLAVGGVQITDSAVTATTGNFTTLSGNLTGTISTATRATTVDTVTSGDAAAVHYLTFVNSHNVSATAETVYTDDGIYYNPGTNTFTTQHATFTGNVTVQGTLTGTATTATRASTVDTTGTSDNSTYYVTFVDTSGGQNGETLRVGTALTLNASTGNVKSAGDLITGSGYLSSSAGTRSLYLYDTTGDVSFQGKAIVNQIRSSTNANALITLSGLDASFAGNVAITGITTIGTGVGITQFSSSVSTGTSTSSVPTSSAVIDYVGTYVSNQVSGLDLTLGINADSGGPSTVTTSQTLTISGTANEVETSVSGQTITVGLPNTVVVGTSLSSPTIRTNLIRSQDTNDTVITISGNDATFADNLTVNGNLYVTGSTTQVNTTALTVEDRTIDLGIVNGAAPSSNTTWDLGILFNYYSSSAAKKSAVIWEHVDSRFKFASVLAADTDGTTVDTPQLTVTTFAPIEVSELWVNNTCTGGSQQIVGCVGSELQLNNITIDAGTF